MTRTPEALAPARRARAESTSRSLRGKQATRLRLLDAGLSLFAERGPHAVTSHAIAARAGFASGTFYLHFPDKLALFRELAEEATCELEARLVAVSATRTEPREIVYAQAEALVGFAEERRELLRIVFHPENELSDVAGRILARLAQGVSDRRRERAAAGLETDCFHADVLAQAIVGMWAHVLAWWAEDPTRATRDDLIRTLTHFQLHGSRSAASDLCGLTDPSEARDSHDPRPERDRTTRARTSPPGSLKPPAGDPTP